MKLIKKFKTLLIEESVLIKPLKNPILGLSLSAFSRKNIY